MILYIIYPANVYAKLRGVVQLREELFFVQIYTMILGYENTADSYKVPLILVVTFGQYSGIET